MDVWRILLYVMAGVLAVRGLVTLMTVHRQKFRQEVLAEEKRVARELRKKARAEAASSDPVEEALAAAGSKRSSRGSPG